MFIATGLQAKEKKADGSPDTVALKQSAATLCAVMGADCLKVATTLPTLSDADLEKPTTIITALSNHFTPQRHVLFERYKFNTAVQAPDESCDQFCIRLRRLWFV